MRHVFAKVRRLSCFCIAASERLRVSSNASGGARLMQSDFVRLRILVRLFVHVPAHIWSAALMVVFNRSVDVIWAVVKCFSHSLIADLHGAENDCKSGAYFRLARQTLAQTLPFQPNENHASCAPASVSSRLRDRPAAAPFQASALGGTFAAHLTAVRRP